MTEMKRIAVLLVAAFLLSAAGCNFGEKEAIKPTEAPTAAPTEAPTEVPTEAPTPEPTTEVTAAPTEFVLPDDISDYTVECLSNADARMQYIIDFISAHPIDLPGEAHPFVPVNMYERLGEEELAVYNAAYEAASRFEELTLSACDDRVMETALNALYVDHPEIETYFTMVRSEDGAGWASLYSLPDARYVEPAEDMDAVKDQAAALDLTARYIASLIPEDFSPIDKYRAIAYYIVDNTQYAHVVGEIPRYATTPFGAVINGYSICQGYALGFEYLCRAANLDCRRLTNGRTDDQMHYWDIVTLDQGAYFVDVTWSDSGSASYRDGGFFRWFMFISDTQHVALDGTATTGMPFDKAKWYNEQ